MLELPIEANEVRHWVDVSTYVLISGVVSPSMADSTGPLQRNELTPVVSFHHRLRHQTKSRPSCISGDVTPPITKPPWLQSSCSSVPVHQYVILSHVEIINSWMGHVFLFSHLGDL